MTALLALCVAAIFGVSIYLMLARELKSIAMGVFLFSHAAHLGILAMSGQPVLGGVLKSPPILGAAGADGSRYLVDPLPQALILTSIVISFAVMAFLLTLLVITNRRMNTIDVDDLAAEGVPTPSDLS